jgi:hypothetical protein
MQPVNQQKAILAVAVVAVIALLTTTFVNNESLIFNVTPEQKAAIKQEQEAVRSRLSYSEGVSVDPVASSLVWEKIFNERKLDEDILQQIGANKPYVPYKVDESKLNISSDQSEAAMTEYGKQLMSILNDYQQVATPLVPEAWGTTAEPSSVYALSTLTTEVTNKILALKVPQPALELQKGVLAGVVPFRDQVRVSDLAIRDRLPRGNPWEPTTFTYLSMQDSAKQVEKGINRITAYYGKPLVIAESTTDENSGWIKTAHALLPGPCIPPACGGVPVTVTTDLPAWWQLLLRDFSGILVTGFVKDQVSAYVKKTQNDFLITNFLHYLDAQINSKYSNDWLNKYIQDPEDRNIIKQFLPQYSCGQGNTDLVRKQLRDKALAYLGFDPTKLDPTSPTFYEDLLKASNPDKGAAALNEDGALLFNKSLAIVAEAEAKSAATNELLSPGKKVPISNDLDPKIVKSLSDIDAEIRAALNSIFGIVEPASATTGGYGFGAYVIGAVKSVIKLFGVDNAVVLQEQNFCIKSPVFNPIVAPDVGKDNNDAAGFKRSLFPRC